MEDQKINRKVKYTKYALKTSLLKLMEQYPISKISVKMLCEKADINRSTFYAHYNNTYDLLKSLEQEVVKDLMEYIDKHIFIEQSAHTVHVLKKMLDYVKKESDLFKVLLSDNGDMSFGHEIMIITQQKTIQELQRYQKIDMRTYEYMQIFVLLGALSILRKWLDDGMIESTQKLSELITKLLYNGLLGFYE